MSKRASARQRFSHEYVCELEGRIRVLEKQLRFAYERIDKLEQLELFDNSADSMLADRAAARPADVTTWVASHRPF